MKKILSIIIALLVVLSIMPFAQSHAATLITNASSVRGSDYTQSAALAAKLDQVFSGDIDIYKDSAMTQEVMMPLGYSMSVSAAYYAKSKINGSRYEGWQCYIYANAVYNKLFNECVGRATSLTNSQILLTGGSTLSYERLKNAGVRTGAYVRTTANPDGSFNSTNAHSFLILAYDANGITVIEGNGNGKGLVDMRVLTWAEFNRSYMSGSGRYLCHIVQPKQSYYDSLYGAASDSLTITGATYPTGTLNAGQSFGLRGTIKSSSKITSVTVGVYKSDGTATAQVKTVSPNTTTFDVKSVDAYIKFGQLPAGNYIYKVIAKNASSTKYLIWTEFTVAAPNSLPKITGATYPLGKIGMVKSFSLRGVITSSTKLTSVTVGVFKTDGTATAQVRTVSPNTTSFDIRSVDAYIKFGQLKAGDYIYKVIATNASGRKILIWTEFTIG
jgi:DNA gyrase inhibitor GyrI